MIYKTSISVTEDIIVKLIEKKEVENIRLNKLQNYYNGNHAILNRVMGDPAKPNNKIVVNYCQLIADFLSSYLVGVPVEYENAPEWLIEVLNYNNNDEETDNLATDMNINGIGFELHYIDENGKSCYTNINPTQCILIENDTLKNEVIGFIRFYPVFDINNNKHYEVDYYTKETIIHYTLDETFNTLTRIGEPVPHPYKEVPVTWVINGGNTQGSFEQVISMQDALNKVVSDELNDFEGFVDSYLVLEGLGATTSQDIAQMKEDRVLLLDPDSKAYWLTKQVNDTQVRELKDRLEKKIKELGRIPDIFSEHTLFDSGEALKMRLVSTEILAKKQENALKKCLQRRAMLLYNIESIKGNTDDYTAINYVFSRSITPTEETVDVLSRDYL